jgi:hypothetical protein
VKPRPSPTYHVRAACPCAAFVVPPRRRATRALTSTALRLGTLSVRTSSTHSLFANSIYTPSAHVEVDAMSQPTM